MVFCRPSGMRREYLLIAVNAAADPASSAEISSNTVAGQLTPPTTHALTALPTQSYPPSIQ